MAIQTPATTKMVQNIIDGTTVPQKALSADTAANVSQQINGKAITNIFESDGLKVKNATLADNAANVTTNINGKSITDIFETDGTTAKIASKLGTDIVGSVSRPIYLNSGRPERIICTDNTSPKSSSSASVYLITERSLYFALPQINGNQANSYNADTKIYAPTTRGSAGSVLVADASGNPSWSDINMRPGSRTNFSLPSSGGSVTPSKNGYCCVSKRSTAANQYMLVSQGGGAQQTAVGTSNGSECSVCIPVKAGTSVTFSYTAAGETVRAFWVYTN